MASVFMLSLALDKPFRLDWNRKGRLEQYFDVEQSFLFPVTNKTEEKLFLNVESEKQFFNFARDVRKSTSSLTIRANILIGIEGVLRNPKFRKEKLFKLFPNFSIQQDRGPLISAVLKFLIGSPNQQLKKLYDKCVGSFLGKSLKIGLQIRVGDSKGDSRVEGQKMDCFSDKIFSDFPVLQNRQKLVVFITGDSDNKFNRIIERIRSQNITIFSSGEKCGELEFSHIDKSMGASTEQWISQAKTFLDWYALTQMDRLYITRSGFGESASMVSQVPTQRFQHWFQTCSWNSFDFEHGRTFYYEHVNTKTFYDKFVNALNASFIQPIKKIPFLLSFPTT